MQNKPQLSAEMEKRFDEDFDWRELQYDGTYYIPTEFAKDFLATALEEQRTSFIKDLEEIIGNSEVYTFPPGVETAYAMYADKKMAIKGMYINGDLQSLTENKEDR